MVAPRDRIPRRDPDTLVPLYAYGEHYLRRGEALERIMDVQNADWDLAYSRLRQAVNRGIVRSIVVNSRTALYHSGDVDEFASSG